MCWFKRVIKFKFNLHNIFNGISIASSNLVKHSSFFEKKCKPYQLGSTLQNNGHGKQRAATKFHHTYKIHGLSRVRKVILGDGSILNIEQLQE